MALPSIRSLPLRQICIKTLERGSVLPIAPQLAMDNAGLPEVFDLKRVKHEKAFFVAGAI